MSGEVTVFDMILERECKEVGRGEFVFLSLGTIKTASSPRKRRNGACLQFAPLFQSALLRRERTSSASRVSSAVAEMGGAGERAAVTSSPLSRNFHRQRMAGTGTGTTPGIFAVNAGPVRDRSAVSNRTSVFQNRFGRDWPVEQSTEPKLLKRAQHRGNAARPSFV